jgi:hypothetical protein
MYPLLYLYYIYAFAVGTTADPEVRLRTSRVVILQKGNIMDFSGFKTKSVKLITDGKEAEARTALEMFGFNPQEIDAFITEVKVEKVQAELGAGRALFANEISDGFNMVLPEVEGDLIPKLARLTEYWTKMPIFTIVLQRMVTKNAEGVEIVTFSWSKMPKFAGASTPTPKTPSADGTPSGKQKSADPPAPYKTWQECCEAVLPEAVKAQIEKKGNTKGFNARIPVRDAIRSGKISLAGWTPEMDY